MNKYNRTNKSDRLKVFLKTDNFELFTENQKKVWSNMRNREHVGSTLKYMESIRREIMHKIERGE